MKLKQLIKQYAFISNTSKKEIKKVVCNIVNTEINLYIKNKNFIKEESCNCEGNCACTKETSQESS